MQIAGQTTSIKITCEGGHFRKYSPDGKLVEFGGKMKSRIVFFSINNQRLRMFLNVCVMSTNFLDMLLTFALQRNIIFSWRYL